MKKRKFGKIGWDISEISLGCWAMGADWGDVSEEDRKANDEAIDFGSRILSSYADRHGIRFWIITEADRSATTILLPEDY